MNVLIIDDSEIALATMKDTLARSGHQVVALPSPIGVTRTAIDQSIEVVVIDVNLPTMRGDALVKLFRKQPRLQKVGVVLVSGIEAAELERLAAECEADAICEKRHIQELLSFAVMNAFNKRSTLTR